MHLTRQAATLAALLSIASSAAAQQIAARACASRAIVADLGYDGTSCVNCTVYNGFIEYLTEPSISQIRDGGPADGKLRENDVLVAVDGSLITTRAAWRKMRALTPGEPVTLTVRRNGAEREVSITPDSRCAPSNDANAAADDDRNKEDRDRLKDDRLREDKLKEDLFKEEKSKDARSKDDWFKEDRYKEDKYKEDKYKEDRYKYQDEKLKEDKLEKLKEDKIEKLKEDKIEKLKEQPSIVIDGKQVIVGTGQNGFRTGTTVFGGKVMTVPGFTAGRVLENIAGRRASSTGWIGIGLECSRCTPVVASAGRYRWRFEDPPSIVEVVAGSPAARAGLKSGDLILQIDNYSLTSVEGGRRWGDINPGDEMTLTVRRGLQSRTVTVQAEERPAQTGLALRAEGRLNGLSQNGFSGRPGIGFGNRLQAESQPQERQGDGDKYYVGGAMVELKGRATSVQYDRSTGELVIVGPDFTVRVRPREDR